MKKPLKSIIIFLILITILASLSLLAHRWFLAGEKTVTVRVADGGGGAYHLPFHLADDMSFFKQEGLTVKTKKYDSGNSALDSLLAGESDVALVGLENFILAKARLLEGDFNATAFAAISGINDAYLLARDSGQSFTWAGLKGKSIICGAPDSIETMVLEEILRRKGLIPYENVTLITNIPEDLKIGALKAGIGSYLLVRGELAAAAEKGGTAVVIASPGEEMGPLPAAICAVDKKFLSEHSAELQKFTNAIYKALIWINYHSAAEIGKLRAGEPEKKKRELHAMLLTKYAGNKVWPDNPLIARDSFTSGVEMLSRAREIPREIAYDETVNDTFARRAVATVKYVPEDKQPKKKFPYNLFK
jgi:NitT/TauT family transport system substrate-binding protein